ncbi:hypothetical protein [Motiliproteus sediminis]|uniref:hypothetical protein n=1 Tax=Motiliproteus sediminis TaxID=1468178 RepID=UPI001AF00176|nr:hypothetical protein [Motiliproteus sediminis]
MFRLWVVLGVLSILAGCSASQHVSEDGAPLYEQRFVIGSHQIPLPEGQWRLVAHNVYQNRNGEAYADVQLVQIDEGERVLTRGVLISANLESAARTEEPKAAFCERDVVYHKQVVRNEVGRDQDCWVTSYFRAAVGRDTDKVSAQTLSYLHRNRIQVPNFAVYTAYRLMSDTDNLTVQYYFNPEYGTRIAPAPRVGWAQSPWHRDNLHRDPLKQAYVEQVKMWSGEWYEQVKLGFAMN